MGTLKNTIIPDSDSYSSEWIAYYKKLKKEVGKTNADSLFLKTWSIQGNSSLKNNAEFVEFFKNKGIDLASSYYDVKTTIAGLGDSIMGIPKKVQRIVTIPVFVGLAGLVIFIGYKIYMKRSN